MKKTISALVAMLAAVSSEAVGWESFPQRSVFSASFETYADNETLSDKGAVGGTWGYPPVPAGSSAKAVFSEGVTYLNCSAHNPGIIFTPRDFGERMIKSVTTSMQLAAYDDLPELNLAVDKAAFTVHAPEGGEAAFVGWTSDGWQHLYLKSGSVAAGDGKWHDVTIRLAERGGATKVQYCLAVDGTSVPLTNAFGVSWLDAAGVAGNTSGEVVNEVEYRGEGGVQWMNGQEPSRGLLVSIVPWRMLTEETVSRHDTGSWPVLKEVSEGHWEWVSEGPSARDGYYVINVSDRQENHTFVPNNGVTNAYDVEFAVRFDGPCEDEIVTDDASALLRIVLEPLTDARQEDPACRFAYLTESGWTVNTDLEAKPECDYTVRISINPQADSTEPNVTYGIREGRGAEGGSYRMLGSARMSLESPLQAFFGGSGRVYSIKTVTQTERKREER